LLVNRNEQTGKTQSDLTPEKKEALGVEARISRLEAIVGQIGEAVLATTETIDRLADRVDALAIQVQHQGHQVQQQGYQLFALSDAVQTLAETQNDSVQQLGQLTETLQRLAAAIEAANK
jgi:ABC-type transporter Mla subunit MlaD